MLEANILFQVQLLITPHLKHQSYVNNSMQTNPHSLIKQDADFWQLEK